MIHAEHVQPKTPNQELLLQSIRRNPITIARGSAGTGKTWCSVQESVNQLAKKGSVRKLVLARAAVPTGRSVGFLPGTAEEKLAPWLAPMISVLRQRLGNGAFDTQKRLGNIQYQLLEVIRGCSFENTMILVDEAQNLSWEELKSITTRLGEGSKLVLMGDPAQRDTKTSRTAIDQLAFIAEKHSLDIGVVTFTTKDIVRSDIVGQLVRVYEEEGL